MISVYFPPMTSTARGATGRLAAAAGVALLAATCLAAPARSAGTPVFRYSGGLATTTSGDLALADASGNGNKAAVKTTGGASLRSTVLPGDLGASYELVQSPGPCLDAPCPQVMATPRTVPDLGTSPFSFGADVYLVGPPDNRAGENVVQRGFAGSDQWKLQVDWHKPTCRFSDGPDTVIVPRPADRVTLTSGVWYGLTCRRAPGNVFSLTVVDRRSGKTVLSRAVTAPSVGAVLPTGPATIGAKKVSTTQDDSVTDQFRGRLDDVFLTVG